MFIDYRSGVTSSPGKANARSTDTYTGLAVANHGPIAANLSFTLRDSSGTTLTVGHGKLSAQSHFAKFVNQLRDVAPDFHVSSDFPSTILFGSLEVESDQPLSILALRLTVNERNETLLTSTPTTDLTRPLSDSSLYFPQAVDGGGYTFTLVLLNTTHSIETGTISIQGDNGLPLKVNRIGETGDSVFPYSIRPGGLFLLQTDGSPAIANAGSLRVTPDVNSPPPFGATILHYSRNGIAVTESGISAASPTTHARIYIDLTATHNTGVALADPGGLGVNIMVKAFRTDGVTGAGSSLGPVVLGGNGHRAAFVDQLISDLPQDFMGVLDLQSETPFVALTMRSLTNSRGDFLLTTLPVADLMQPASGPIVFPQIADGGGYRTQFILLGSGGTSKTTLSYLDETGAPLAVAK